MKRYLLASLLVLLSACQSLPPVQPLPLNPYGQASVVHSQFNHLLVQKLTHTQRLHVYIDGDGIPFPNRFQAAADPSPTFPVLLQWMQYDRTSSIYLGRPCYFTHWLPELTDPGCSARYWTDARYNEAVIASMTDALRQFLALHPARGVTLIGHSGGGAIATLMAARMPEVDQLVTVAGNLDTDAWTHYHHYNRLKASLNPAQITGPMPQHQLHFMGAKDDNIPPALTQSVAARLGSQATVLPDADHNCYWFKRWPQLLQQIEQQAQAL